MSYSPIHIVIAKRPNIKSPMDRTYGPWRIQVTTFFIKELLKTTRKIFRQLSVEFRSYPDNEKICVIKILHDYIGKNKKSDNNRAAYDQSLKNPHLPVSTSTMTRLFKTII